MFKDRNLKAYDKDYYERQSHMRNDYLALAKWISTNVDGKLYGDVGCGEGYLITDLYKEFGKEVWGVDGSPGFEHFVNDEIRSRIGKVDLTKKLKLQSADVAISMEVGEHLPEKSADTFLDNIVSTGADFIVFTAAPPGQDGTNHINLQPPEYWEEKFNQRGYTKNTTLSQKFKDELKDELQHAWWYINNIIILEKN